MQMYNSKSSPRLQSLRCMGALVLQAGAAWQYPILQVVLHYQRCNCC